MSENILEKIIIKKKAELEIYKANNPVESLMNIIENNNYKNIYLNFKEKIEQNINNNQRVTIRYKYSSDANYKEVWLYKYLNGGHSWNSDDYSIEEEIWGFFMQMSEEETDPLIIKENYIDKELIQIIDILGRDSKEIKGQPLFYIYDDGSIKKRIIIE